MIEHDFILLIFNCQKYRFKAIKQINTWLHNFNIMPYYHVIGNPDLNTDYVLDDSEHTLYVKTNDDYVSLPNKVISAYKAIQTQFTFKYIFKTDDDQFLNNINFFKTLQTILLNKTPKIHYAGNIVKVDQPYFSDYCIIHPELPQKIPILKSYCSGRFYVLSDLAIQQLLTKIKDIQKEYLEDYAIGLYLDPILKKNILHIQTDKYFSDFI